MAPKQKSLRQRRSLNVFYVFGLFLLGLIVAAGPVWAERAVAGADLATEANPVSNGLQANAPKPTAPAGPSIPKPTAPAPPPVATKDTIKPTATTAPAPPNPAPVATTAPPTEKKATRTPTPQPAPTEAPPPPPPTATATVLTFIVIPGPPPGVPPPPGGYQPPYGGYQPPYGGYQPPYGGYQPPYGGNPPDFGGSPPPYGGYPPNFGGSPPQYGYPQGAGAYQPGYAYSANPPPGWPNAAAGPIVVTPTPDPATANAANTLDQTYSGAPPPIPPLPTPTDQTLAPPPPPGGSTDTTSEPPPTEPAWSSPTDLGQLNAMLQLVNDFRAANGLTPLAVDRVLQRAADWLAVDQLVNLGCVPAGACSDRDSFGNQTQTRLSEGFGYPGTALGELITAGSGGAMSAAAEVFDTWQANPDQAAVLLNPDAGAIGIARFCGPNDDCIWVAPVGDLVVDPFNPAALAESP